MTVDNRMEQTLAAALDGAIVERGGHHAGPDVVIRTRDGRSIGLDVKWAGEGWPQDVRGVASKVPDPWPANVVLMARRLSPGALERLRERGANWADEAGQARIIGPDGLIVIREPAPLPPEDRGRVFKWSRSASAIAETVLAEKDDPIRATELAPKSGWSVPQTANVLSAFDSQGWTAKRGAARGPGAHRQLVDADGMLASWAAALAGAPRQTRVAHRATRDVMALLRDALAPELDRTSGWAVTGWGALELVAPFATTTPSLHIYVSDRDFAGPLSDAIENAGLREIDDAGRVTFWAADSQTLKRVSRSDGDFPVVSPPRLFADLNAFGARGGDAADHVKAQLIDPLHPTARTADENGDG